MTFIFRLSIISVVCLVSACASSHVQAPVVVGKVESSSDQKAGGSSNKPIGSDPYMIESNPLPSTEPLVQQPNNKNRASVSPVLRRLLAKAETARAQKNWVQSEAYLERALRISPKNALVWHRIARVKLQQSKDNQAIQFALKSNTLARDDNSLKRRNWSVIAEANTALNRPIKANEARRKSQGNY